MFKKIRENEGVLKFKELWQNKKTHDIMVLCLWLAFIFIVILFARSMNSSTSYSEEKKVLGLSDISSYDFTYKIDDKEFIGQYYDDSIMFYKDNKRYYYNKNLYLIDDNVSMINNYDLSVLKINLNMIDRLISGITPSEINGTKQYIVSLDKFINLYEIDTDIDLSKSTLYNVPISIYYDMDDITKVTLDLTSYYSLKTGMSGNYVLTMNLYNINNILDFRKAYDKLLEVK